ncbi:MAG: ATP-binding cassette domain-containing protein, partial [Pseudomonadota bacterium]
MERGPTLEAFAGATLDRIEARWRGAGGAVRHYRFGPLELSVRGLGDALGRALAPAIAHAEVAEAPAGGARAYAVDGRAFPELAPPPDWPWPGRAPDDQLGQYDGGAEGAAILADLYHGVWSLGQPAQGRHAYLLGRAAGPPDWDVAAPFRGPLDWAAGRVGMQLCHSAAIGLGGRGVLLTGPGGSGKSTTVKLLLGILKPDEGEVNRIKGLTVSYVPQKVTIDWTLP